jgi:hypothetical protein
MDRFSQWKRGNLLYNLTTFKETYISKVLWQPNIGNEPNGNNIYMYMVPGENTESDAEMQSESETNKSIPGSKICYVIIGLLGAFMYIRI